MYEVYRSYCYDPSSDRDVRCWSSLDNNLNFSIPNNNNNGIPNDSIGNKYTYNNNHAYSYKPTNINSKNEFPSLPQNQSQARIPHGAWSSVNR
eukprot:UN03602